MLAEKEGSNKAEKRRKKEVYGLDESDENANENDINMERTTAPPIACMLHEPCQRVQRIIVNKKHTE